MAPPPTTAPALERVLAGRRWTWRSQPFPLVVGRNVLAPAVYTEMVEAFRALRLAAEDAALPPGCTRYAAEYVDWGVDFGGQVPAPFSLFFSPAWHDMLAGVLGIDDASGHMSGGLHHHAAGGRPGRVHNDLNPGWFPGRPREGTVLISSPSVDYKTGEVHDRGAVPVETIRAATMILYLDNGAWAPEDGGGTGLFARSTDRIDRPAAVVPPIDNSLLAFECTPYSFHGFLGSASRPRSSLILWLHRDRQAALARWGESPVVPWRR